MLPQTVWSSPLLRSDPAVVARLLPVPATIEKFFLIQCWDCESQQEGGSFYSVKICIPFQKMNPIKSMAEWESRGGTAGSSATLRYGRMLYFLHIIARGKGLKIWKRNALRYSMN